jgi:hypothetical protein
MAKKLLACFEYKLSVQTGKKKMEAFSLYKELLGAFFYCF